MLTTAKYQTSQNIAKSGLFHIRYINSDVVQNQLAGDVKAPLLRVGPVKERKFTYVRYDRPQFLPINRSNILDIEVNVKAAIFFHFNQESPS